MMKPTPENVHILKKYQTMEKVMHEAELRVTSGFIEHCTSSESSESCFIAIFLKKMKMKMHFFVQHLS